LLVVRVARAIRDMLAFKSTAVPQLHGAIIGTSGKDSVGRVMIHLNPENKVVHNATEDKETKRDEPVDSAFVLV
jgi:hypothetical protein